MRDSDAGQFDSESVVIEFSLAPRVGLRDLSEIPTRE